MNRYEKVEFWIMACWSVVMIPLGVYSVIKGHDVPMGLSTAYCGALGSYALKVAWLGKKGDSNDNNSSNSN
jgi:hypothetical protein